MQNKKKKTRLVSYNALSNTEQKDMRRLGLAAAKGLMLVGFNIPFISYRLKQQASELVDFSIDYQENADQTYFYRLKKGKWEHVFSYKHLHFFKAPISTKPIYTDVLGKANFYKQQIKLFVGFLFLGLLVASGLFALLAFNINFGFEWLFNLYFLGFTISSLVVILMFFTINSTIARVNNIKKQIQE